MSEEANGTGTVSYTVKELLARQDGKLDTIILTLASKADRSDLDKVEGRVGTLEALAAQQQGSSGFSRWAVPVLISLIAVGLSIAAMMAR